MSEVIYTAPPGTGTAILGKTLPDLMYDACRQFPNPKAFNQHLGEGQGWRAYSLSDFRRLSEATAAGFHRLGLHAGDRVALFMESDVPFCIVDMGCLIGGIIDVPIYLSHAPEAVKFVVDHSESRAVVCSSVQLLESIKDLIGTCDSVEHVIVLADENDELPDRIGDKHVYALGFIQEWGASEIGDNPSIIDSLVEKVDAHDLATIIYTSGTTGTPKGVMLSHENISSNGMTAFTGLTGHVKGPGGETGLSFLPLTHVFARTLHYGYLANGMSVYFAEPANIREAFREVRPTVFATVPRVLEKIYAGLLERFQSLPAPLRGVMNWAVGLARRYELGTAPQGWYAVQLRIADKIAFKKWREALGGRARFVISGGAALNGDLANFFAAMGVNVLQGYGLTETSPVITFNRPNRNRAGVVGEPIPPVEVKIADDGEVLTRGPHVMMGYYKDPDRTRDVLSPDGWFHTGDIGEFDGETRLKITDRKKDLFKLSTGKYVMPQPIEVRLTAEPLIEQAVVIGANRQFCSALIFPNKIALERIAEESGLGSDEKKWYKHPTILREFQKLVDKANAGMDPWSTVKKFALVDGECTIESGLLTPTLKVKRPAILTNFAGDIERIYRDASVPVPKQK